MLDNSVNKYNLLKEQITKYNIISFDLFDTLIFRTVRKPEDIFDLVENTYNIHHKDKRIQNYRNIRIRSEIKARKERSGHEIKIDDIFKYIPYEKDEARELENLEKKIEIKNCLPNNEMVSIANEAFDLGKTVIITTDMYLDRDTVTKILSKIKLKYTRLFISSEEGETKASGRLYQIVASKMNVRPSEILHIGDNEEKDIRNARENGFEAAKCIDLRQNTLLYSFSDSERKSVEINQLESFLIDKNIPFIDSPEYSIGYTILGPFLYDFCKWIKKQSKKNDIEKLVFLSREGFLLKDIYLTIFPEDKDKVSYASLNKNVLRFPELAINNSIDAFKRTIASRSYIYLYELFKYFRVDEKDSIIEEICESKNVSLNRKYLITEIDCQEFQEIYQRLLEYKKHDIEYQFELFKQYIKELGFENRRVGLVNNSIYGSGQSLLSDIFEKLGISCDIIGLQFVADDKCYDRLGKESVKAWLTDESFSSKYRSNRFASNCLLFEHLLFEPVGTALYLEQNGDGSIGVIHKDVVMEDNNFSKVKQIQEYACKFCRDFNDVAVHYNNKSFVGLIYKLLYTPRYEDAKLIAGLYDDDDVQGSKKILEPEQEKLGSFLKVVKRARTTSWRAGYIEISNYPEKYLRDFNAIQKVLDVRNTIKYGV